MKQSASKKIRFAVITLLVLCIVFVLAYQANAPSLVPSGSDREVSLENSWTVSRDGAVEENRSLPISVFSDGPGRISMSRAISAQRPENSALCIFFYTAPFTVSFQGQQIYEYGLKAAADGYQSVGSGFHIIELPDGAGELRITAEFTGGAPGAILSEATVIPGADFIRQFLFTRLFTIIAVLILFAVFLYTLVSGGSRIGKTAGGTQALAFLAITAAVWLLARSGLLQLFTNNLILLNGIDFLSFYLLPVFALRFVQRRLLLPDKRLPGCLTANLLFIIGACILHMLRIVDFTQTLFVFHLLLFVDIVCVVLSVFRAGSKHIPYMNALRAGVVILAGGGVLELVTYYLVSFQFLRFSFLECAFLAFTLCMLYVWNSESKEIREQLVQQSKFRKMAYHDKLTGLSNRAAYEREAEKLVQPGSAPCYIFMIDLNGLKMINDREGHGTGDQFIINSAEVLKKAVGSSGKLFRFGGDEFVVLLPGGDMEAAALYKKLLPYIVPNSGTVTPSFAVGYAVFDSGEGESLDAVLRRADKRMYACKSKLHANKEI